MCFHGSGEGTGRRGGQEVCNCQFQLSQPQAFVFDNDEQQRQDSFGFIQEASKEGDAGAGATEDRSATGPGNSGSADS
jgi:hypothetical protein